MESKKIPHHFSRTDSTQPAPLDLKPAVRLTIETHRMLTAGDRVLVGVSGGPDSMALLHLLDELASGLEIHLGVAHLNHCLRGKSADQDAQVVGRAAKTLKHPCHLGRAHVRRVKQKLGLSLEEAARRVRYAFFNKIMRMAGYNKLALGHHMDDNAEQMLMALLRGAGPRGLSGIAPVREKKIIRPLIHSRRSQIEDYVRNAGIDSVKDASNDDLRFARNRIRHRLLPLLAAEYNPRIIDQLNRLADVTRTEEAWIDVLTTSEYDRTVVDREKGAIDLSIESLKRAHPALARRLVRMALQELTGSLRRINFSHTGSILRLLTAGSQGKACHLPGGIRAYRNGRRLMLRVVTDSHRDHSRSATPEKRPPATLIPTPFPATIDIQTMGVGLRFFTCRPDQLPGWSAVDQNWAHFDLQRLALPLTLRPPVPGDRFTPLGAAGSQKLKKFFIDHRIPRQARTMVPVLEDRRRIIWLVGQRMDDHVKVTAQTSRVLSVEIFLLDTR